MRSFGNPTALTPSRSDTSLAAHLEGSSGPYLAPEFGNRDAEGTQLDVFGLGALSHLILTGQPPAQGRAELAKRLQGATERALVPSAVSDDVSPAMDDLVRGATAVQPDDRYESVGEFRDWLEPVEEELTVADSEDVPDLLEAREGTVVQDWRVEKVLGKGSTARALLVTRKGEEQVLKVALNDVGRERLAHEVAQLRRIHDSDIVRLIEGPLELVNRSFLVLEQAGQQTLAQYLRSHGRLTIDDLQNLGDHLFQAVGYLEDDGSAMGVARVRSARRT